MAAVAHLLLISCRVRRLSRLAAAAVATTPPFCTKMKKIENLIKSTEISQSKTTEMYPSPIRVN